MRILKAFKKGFNSAFDFKSIFSSIKDNLDILAEFFGWLMPFAFVLFLITISLWLIFRLIY